MVMEMQTIADQANRRIDVILNDYPTNYFDTYPERIAQVTSDQVRDVMNKYVQDNRMTMVIVAPASTVKDQLAPLGTVQVLPMPLNRPGVSPTTAPSQEILK
jgi:predicted Zn-dependent peptidase